MVKIEFKTVSDAFRNNGDGLEIARILRELAELAENDQLAERNIRDKNGNVIGKCVYKQ